MEILHKYCDFCHRMIPKDSKQYHKNYLLPIYEDKYESFEPDQHLCPECRQKVLDLYEKTKAEFKKA